MIKNIFKKIFGFSMFILTIYWIFSTYSFMALSVSFIFFIVIILRLIAKKWKIASIYFLYLLIIISLYNFNMRVAEKNSIKVINAVNKFKVENQEYPNTLNDLVPNYIKKIPNVSYRLNTIKIFKEFQYTVQNYPNHGNDNAELMWFTTPPYARTIYYFETKTKRFID